MLAHEPVCTARCKVVLAATPVFELLEDSQ